MGEGGVGREVGSWTCTWTGGENLLYDTDTVEPV